MKKELSYIDSVHRDGRIWNLSMVGILLLFPIMVSILFRAPVDWRGFRLLWLVLPMRLIPPSSSSLLLSFSISK